MMIKNVIITQSNYIPWKGYFDAINIADEFIVYDDMQYTRRDWRNRNKIKTANGLQWLTIPVEVKGKYTQKINETRVADANWGEKHWKSIEMSYSKAPFFSETAEKLEPLFMHPVSDMLTEINKSLLERICSILSIKTRIRDSRDFKLTEGKTERLVDLCLQVGANNYYSGPAAKSYMDESLFTKKQIEVHYFDYSNYPEYKQLNGDFTHEVSILDLLFNEGPNANGFMKSFQ